MTTLMHSIQMAWKSVEANSNYQFTMRNWRLVMVQHSGIKLVSIKEVLLYAKPGLRLGLATVLVCKI